MQFKSKSGGSNNPYLIKLKSGESVTGILRGEPLEFEKAFNPGEKPGFRFRINMVVKVDGALTALILEQGWKTYKQLSGLQDAGWKLENCFVKVSRQGTTKTDTVYTVAALPNMPTAEALAQVAAIKLRDLHEGLDQPPKQEKEESFDSFEHKENTISDTSDLPF